MIELLVLFAQGCFWWNAVFIILTQVHKLEGGLESSDVDYTYQIHENWATAPSHLVLYLLLLTSFL